MITTQQLDAKTFTEKTIETLQANGIDLSRLLSQCYDRANVMSGKKGGVSGLLEQYLNRKIPYIHCFNHRLHLVVVKAVSDNDSLKNLFDMCVMLCYMKFFIIPKFLLCMKDRPLFDCYHNVGQVILRLHGLYHLTTI